MKRKFFDHFKNQRGAVAVVVAIMIILLVGFAALAIDIGYAMVNKNELQNVADGAALAAARELGEIYTAMTPTDQQKYEMDFSDLALILAAARQVSDKYKVANAPINIGDADVRVGRWGGNKFSATFDLPNAVNVTVRRDGTVNGPIMTFLAGVLGKTEVHVSVTATASLLNTFKISEGNIQFPLALSQTMFNGEHCGKSVAIYSTSLSNAPADAGCGGWNILQEQETDEIGKGELLKDKVLQGLIDGDYRSPEMIADLTSLNFTNGNVASAFEKMEKLFEKMKKLNDNENFDFDDDPNTWTTIAPVYDGPCNPAGWIPITGFASITVTGVDYPGRGAQEDGTNGEKVVRMTINCKTVVRGVSGGVEFGAPGIIPNLVQ